MKAEKLLENISIKNIKGTYEGIEVVNIETNSKLCKTGTVFVCTVGVNSDSHNFVEEAENNGACILIVEKFVESSLPQILVDNTRQTLALLSSNFFDNANQKLRIVGVTGTNGKTTTTYICKQILESSGKKVGLIGTEGTWIGDEFFEGELTTPDPFKLHKIFADMVKSNCEFCVMEVSAHAIALSKIYGIKFEIGLITNITQDHLDYFENMENYAKTKLSFLASSDVALAIVNADDEKCYTLKEICKKKIVFFGRENPADVFCTNVNLMPKGTSFFVNAYDEISQVETFLCGDFNVSNILGSVAICMHLGLSLKEICLGLKKVKPVEGRFNIIEIDSKRCVVIDFAHTPDGIEKILQSVNKICPKPIIALFGASGNRDRGKRSKMGNVAEENADFLVITSDNPKFEKPEFIIFEICKGLKKSNHIIIPDRSVAVSIALEYLSEGGTLVLCGKGAEKYQDINGVKCPYNDYEEVQKFIEAEKKAFDEEETDVN